MRGKRAGGVDSASALREGVAAASAARCRCSLRTPATRARTGGVGWCCSTATSCPAPSTPLCDVLPSGGFSDGLDHARAVPVADGGARRPGGVAAAPTPPHERPSAAQTRGWRDSREPPPLRARGIGTFNPETRDSGGGSTLAAAAAAIRLGGRRIAGCSRWLNGAQAHNWDQFTSARGTFSCMMKGASRRTRATRTSTSTAGRSLRRSGRRGTNDDAFSYSSSAVRLRDGG